jgi:hypothetical protein
MPYLNILPKPIYRAKPPTKTFIYLTVNIDRTLGASLEVYSALMYQILRKKVIVWQKNRT